MPSAADDIRRAIDRAGGPLRFDEYLDVALYGENGFYSGGGRAGRDGDFLTSPEVGPLFGTVLARALQSWWNDAGRPVPFVVVEIGAGPGTLARAVLASGEAFVGALRWCAVEKSHAQQLMHPSEVESRSDIPAERAHVVIGNEILDNVPFRLFVNDGGWKESHVDIVAGQCVEVLRPCAPDVIGLPESAPHGARIPLQTAAAELVDRCASIVNQGRMLFFDYCTDATAELAAMPWREWLRTYQRHGRGRHYLVAPGEQDVTAQVALDQLAVAVPGMTVVSQADFLRTWGIDELVAEGRRAWDAAAHNPTVAALRMRSRVREAEALTDPAGLGGFHVLQWTIDANV